ncbi:hypothetical protein F2Q69_00043911 [Brassica cretica]|uniref:Uncharacterized protein n=1 Tax=Brassica cretica TaxID=69181 RepID=A0A8S9NC77_BRACR|nr:hypothetical protein F2Q69_00043911 [Brassica cretica]
MGIASKGPRIVLRELRRGCTVSGREVGPCPWARARGLCYGNLDEDARFWDGRSSSPMGEVTSVETALAYDRDLIQTDPLLDIPREQYPPRDPRDLFAKRDLLRNGPIFWDSFTLDGIRNAVALYRSRGISRPLCASDMDEPYPGVVPD